MGKVELEVVEEGAGVEVEEVLEVEEGEVSVDGIKRYKFSVQSRVHHSRDFCFSGAKIGRISF
jgi:hypothetical protein